MLRLAESARQSGQATTAVAELWPLAARLEARATVRTIGPADMVRNTRLGEILVDPRHGLVTLDGTPLRSEPAQDVALNRLYFL
ncbi:hypothetical protein [Kitasatospora aureofaciens]|uniref:hypothetical protein n=1 Tax=Kitasatospora aureofaciens TaxID=1894 RepID=UPI000526608C|nr:hypothetical protein [Kitasatospora aureofaciens]